ncbi:MAG: hypothetical protein ACT4PE_05585 [Candidatus Eiseniibacteriota bacterium]
MTPQRDHDGHLRILPRDLLAYAVLLAAILGQWYALNAKIDSFMEVSEARHKAADADRERIWDVLVGQARASGQEKAAEPARKEGR